ncbi:MAG: bifunctional UDP-3-O-[3-hydroxymyristoyl] N-acetylglucosamine deacetylase/3-hydroxyacyl-ACP dehydratase [Candidatus Omnitrophica bacterium]|nr:bifunctional UDP-3-O-[3-hydroxymyristoyl] N-acetylglucosamine deacetylase/3-hydroxyacyl-ACP dehydratase [Candidatus Omnitrophota bacterium]MDD5310880.1 bifunctional UDP-3-O-[3-hydroxymyristoyl] N-acetylglucosamine deacetylase/3-hydroxyacyl-ACP dehydratase [Candidatus Omnitrophota bacterium]MDD5546376.1 bifunctional UDP-3-O-[3-hydroxymyristoyl] N-acetylglucosamine deacetylase/3-hydroxyacyl-ACP dehydratase [Candidatus Omnitrophota bacterium]
MEQQLTIKNAVETEGTGLHTGTKVKMRLLPAEPNSGISFIRVDLPDSPVIKANTANVMESSRKLRRTSLSCNGVEVHTVEHLLSALSGMMIDNIKVEINGPELPGFDGSAMPFVELIKKAGAQSQPEQKRTFTVKDPIWLEENDTVLAILPDSELKISYMLSYDHPLLRSQYVSVVITPETYEKEIAPTRTFCLEAEAEELRRQGLGKGANFENTLVVGKDGVIKNKLRFSDEFARHKVSDLMGDLYLLGMPLKGHVIAVKSGHPLNVRLLQKIRQQQERMRAGAMESKGPGIVGTPLDINDIKKILPHRYPFLLVDRVIELEDDKRAVGIKNVTMNEFYFPGHFPNMPIMPGVLIMEALAQVAGVMMLNKRENLGKYAFFMSMDKVKFRKAVVPGDQLVLETEVLKLRSKTVQVKAVASVDGKIVAEGEFMFALVGGEEASE